MQWLLWHLASAQAIAALLSPWERQAGVGTRTAPAASWGDPMPTASGWIAQMYPVHVVQRAGFEAWEASAARQQFQEGSDLEHSFCGPQGRHRL